MVLEFEHILNATKNLVLKYPEIEGTYYSIYFWTPGDKIRNIFFNFFKDLLIPKRKLPQINEKIWYLIHGELPSNYLNLQSITKELNNRDLRGKILCYKAKGLENEIFAWEKIKIKKPSIYLNKIDLLKLFIKKKKVAVEYDISLRNYEKENSVKFPNIKFLLALAKPGGK